MDSRTLDYTLHANKADLWITLHGEEALVIKNIRELYFQFLQNDECSWLKISKSSKIDEIHSDDYYIPCGLWTRDEAEEDQKVREAINECEIDVRLPSGERWAHFFNLVSRTVQQTFSTHSLDEPLGKKFP